MEMRHFRQNKRSLNSSSWGTMYKLNFRSYTIVGSCKNVAKMKWVKAQTAYNDGVNQYRPKMLEKHSIVEAVCCIENNTATKSKIEQ